MAKKKDPKAPKPLSEKDVNKGIKEYQKLKGSRRTPETVHVPGRRSTVQIDETGWPKGTEKWAEKPKSSKRSPGLARPIPARIEPGTTDLEYKRKNPPRPSASKVRLAKPVTPIEPRKETRVRVAKPQTGKGELAVRPKGELGIRPSGAITKRVHIPEVVSTPSKIRGRVGKLAPLGWIAASAVGGERTQTALAAGMHADTARAAAKALTRRAAPWLGAAFAAKEIYDAGKAAVGAVQAQREAEHRSEAMATKYASPLVHAQNLRSGKVGRAPGAAAPVRGPKFYSLPTISSSDSKASAAPSNAGFGSAFASARKAGKSEFEYKGKRYNTKLKSDAVSVKPKSEAPKQTVFDPNKDVSNIAFASPEKATSEPKKASFGAFLRKHQFKTKRV